MMTLTKADNFDMTMMFCEDSDKALVAEIANKQSDKKKAKDIKSKYQCDWILENEEINLVLESKSIAGSPHHLRS